MNYQVPDELPEIDEVAVAYCAPDLSHFVTLEEYERLKEIKQDVPGDHAVLIFCADGTEVATTVGNIISLVRSSSQNRVDGYLSRARLNVESKTIQAEVHPLVTSAIDREIKRFEEDLDDEEQDEAIPLDEFMAQRRVMPEGGPDGPIQ